MVYSARSNYYHKALALKNKRPINLDITTIRLPLPAIVSILHRVSGVVLFGGVAVLLWLHDKSLESAVGFRTAEELLEQGGFKLLIWLILAALIWHLAAGARHLLMDLGIGESLEGGRMGAWAVVAVTVVAVVLMAIWLW